MTDRPKRFSRRTLGVAALALSVSAMAADRPAAKPYASVEHATFHQLVFANDDVAVLKNLYPPHGDSDYHVHPRDLFFVLVTSAHMSTQQPGQPLTEPQHRLAGSVGYNLVAAESFVHRVINNDDQPLAVVAVEIRRPAPSSGALTNRGDAYVQILDNPRLRAWRVVLAPGQSIAALTQRANGVRVVVRGGLLRTERPGISDQVLELQNGDFAYQEAGETRALHNVGTTSVELVEFELK